MDTFHLDLGAVLSGEESDGCGAGAGAVLIQHTMQQAAMSDELQTIEESLGLKEKLLEQLQVSLSLSLPLSPSSPSPSPSPSPSLSLSRSGSRRSSSSSSRCVCVCVGVRACLCVEQLQMRLPARPSRQRQDGSDVG
jgi:hypothetical protein